ncbi:MAG: methyltransferase domain-containing protein [Candidatus Berkelbacteria bacterium]|nr:methyltransferase domain-containing protein [Candidatus Berkelbacteria bacterium]
MGEALPKFDTTEIEDPKDEPVVNDFSPEKVKGSYLSWLQETEKLENDESDENSEFWRERLNGESAESRRLAGAVRQAIEEMLSNQSASHEAMIVFQNIVTQSHEITRGIFAGEYHEDLTAKGRWSILREFNRELMLVLIPPRIPESFIKCQFILHRFTSNPYYDEQVFDPTKYRPIEPGEVAAGQEKIMSEINLQEYEGKTTNTATALENLIPEAYETKPDYALTVLDIGCGDGRVAIPLAALGHQVNALDISDKMIAGLAARAERFSQDYIEQVGTIHQHGKVATTNSLLNTSIGVFEKINSISDDFERDVENIPEHINGAVGDFFELDQVEYEKRFGSEPADVAIIMWHTFGFAGTHDGELQVLKNIYQNLQPGGRIIIEMPDRNFGPYFEAIAAHYASELGKKRQDPNYKPYPLGTLFDAPSKQEGALTSDSEEVAVPRYLPSNREIQQVMEEAGFSFLKIKNYFVSAKNEQGEVLVIKENMFVAEKPHTKEQLEEMVSQQMQKSDTRPTELE